LANINDDLLIKKLSGNTDPGEEEQIRNWLSESGANLEYYTQLKLLWQSSKISEYSAERNLDRSLKKFHNRIDKIKVRARREFIFRTLKYAAVFAGIAAIAVAYIFIKPFAEPVMITHKGNLQEKPEKVVLPDGTGVWLNKGATLEYPAEFKKHSRQVSIAGEAFFEVVKDSKRPFTVNSGSLKIEVTGTSFNVNTAVKGKLMQTVLVEGSVTLSDSKSGKLCVLKPGEMAEYDPGNQTLTISDVNTRVYTAWHEGLVVLEDASLDEILDKVSKVYNVEFQYNSDSGNQKKYNFVFRKTQDFDTVFNMLKFIAPVNSIKHTQPKNQ